MELMPNQEHDQISNVNIHLENQSPHLSIDVAAGAMCGDQFGSTVCNEARPSSYPSRANNDARAAPRQHVPIQKRPMIGANRRESKCPSTTERTVARNVA